MKVLSAILLMTTFLVSSVALSGHCFDSKSEWDSTLLEHCTQNNNDQNSSSDHKNHHCYAHCLHQIATTISLADFNFFSFEAINNFNYRFSAGRTFLEGPFRPPLS
ncbi:MAG: hypothetical protein IPM57_08745 [Oligoflexia bacterium]|nr:hypothetical protein [Oligoflexia bacterium]